MHFCQVLEHPEKRLFLGVFLCIYKTVIAISRNGQNLLQIQGARNFYDQDVRVVHRVEEKFLATQ